MLLGQRALHARHGLRQHLDRLQEGHAHEVTPVLAEAGAGEDEHVVLEEERGELEGGDAGGGRVRPDVEPTPRLAVGEPHLVQGAHEQAAPRVVGLTHLADALLRAL